MNKRKILFNINLILDEDLSKSGIYKIINLKNNDIYIGSSSRSFKERFKEHSRNYYLWTKDENLKLEQPKLWNAFKKYDIINFTVEIIEIIDLDINPKDYILQREEYYINKLNPKYNICKTPTKGGIPNKGIKLTEEWKNNIRNKSKLYTHSDETLKIVTENNKKNACKIIFTDINTNEKFYFESWVEAGKVLNGSSDSMRKAPSRNNKWKNYKVEVIKTQKKKVKVYLENGEKIFNSYSECDKYFNMWRGYTSTLINNKLVSKLIIDKYKYKII